MFNHSDTDDDRKIAEQMAHVKNRLLVFSGKGGVGKSTVSANLALALSTMGLKVGLMDVDIHGPNLAKMLGVESKLASNTGDQLIPIQINENLKLISIAFFLESPGTPIIWRGPLKMKLIRQFLGETQWGDLDWLIIDSPPGTGDEPLSVAQLIPEAGAVIVTTPQEVALLDSRKAISFARMLKLDILGLIENMSGLTCPHCNRMINLFKTGGGEKLAKELNIQLLGRIPIDPSIVEAGDNGLSFKDNQVNEHTITAFNQIVKNIIERGPQSKPNGMNDESN